MASYNICCFVSGLFHSIPGSWVLSVLLCTWVVCSVTFLNTITLKIYIVIYLFIYYSNIYRPFSCFQDLASIILPLRKYMNIKFGPNISIFTLTVVISVKVTVHRLLAFSTLVDISKHFPKWVIPVFIPISSKLRIPINSHCCQKMVLWHYQPFYFYKSLMSVLLSHLDFN